MRERDTQQGWRERERERGRDKYRATKKVWTFRLPHGGCSNGGERGTHSRVERKRRKGERGME